MKKLALALLLCSPLMIFAQEAPQNAQDNTQVCASCHGPKGISTQPIWPNIAGQHASYIQKQLMDIKQNKLPIATTMTAIVASLSQKDIDDLAVYYAKMPIPKGETPTQYLKRGEQLYRGGDFEKHITACIACHGPQGTGNAQAGFPVLSGQRALYSIAQLKAFKEGKRANDLNHIMRDISSRMSDDDITAVAHYTEGLH